MHTKKSKSHINAKYASLCFEARVIDNQILKADMCRFPSFCGLTGLHSVQCTDGCSAISDSLTVILNQQMAPHKALAKSLIGIPYFY